MKCTQLLKRLAVPILTTMVSNCGSSSDILGQKKHLTQQTTHVEINMTTASLLGLDNRTNSDNLDSSNVSIEAANQLSETCDEGIRSYQESVYPLLRNNCVECHGGDGEDPEGPSFAVEDVESSYHRIFSYLNFDVISDSVLVKVGGNNHCQTDHDVDCNTSSADLAAAVTSWWENGEQSCPRKGRLRSTGFLIPDDLPSRDEGYRTLHWDLSNLGSKYNRTYFEIDAQEFSPTTDEANGSYRFRKPRLAATRKTLHLRDLSILVNGKFNTMDNTFITVDKTVNKKRSRRTESIFPHPVLSAKSTIVLQDPSSDVNEIYIGFEELEIAANESCDSIQTFIDRVKPTLEARNCVSCHGYVGTDDSNRVTATKRFKMNIDDMDLCLEFKQRSEKMEPFESPIIAYPLRGVNGHPRVIPSIDEVQPWVQWINEELN